MLWVFPLDWNPEHYNILFKEIIWNRTHRFASRCSISTEHLFFLGEVVLTRITQIPSQKHTPKYLSYRADPSGYSRHYDTKQCHSLNVIFCSFSPCTVVFIGFVAFWKSHSYSKRYSSLICSQLVKHDILMVTLQVISNTYWIYRHWISTVGFSALRKYLKITKIWTFSMMRVCIKREFETAIEAGSNNPFKCLLITMQFSRAVLSKGLRILNSLNKESVWEFLFWTLSLEIYSLINELVFCAQTRET